MQSCENLQETLLLWLTDSDHMFVFTFAFAVLVINHPFIPCKCRDFFTQLVECPWRKAPIKIQPVNIPLVSHTPILSPLKSADGLLWCLGFFNIVSFFSSGDYSSLASGEMMENNHNPSSESTGLAYINIDGNLACFLCLQCFREFYCSPVSLLRQYLWVGRPVYSIDKEQQWMAV